MTAPVNWKNPVAVKAALELISLLVVDRNDAYSETITARIRGVLGETDPTEVVRVLAGLCAALFDVSNPEEADRAALFREFVVRFEQDMSQ